jgi:hypothetical protein
MALIKVRTKLRERRKERMMKSMLKMLTLMLRKTRSKKVIKMNQVRNRRLTKILIWVSCKIRKRISIPMPLLKKMKTT